jgi:hypothetical protein
MRPLLLLLMTAGIAACSGSETVTVARTETRTVTVTRTVTKQPKPPAPRIAAPPARTRVFVPSHDSLVYKPDAIGVGASSAITEIRWTTYGGQTAVGKGIFPSNDCVPSCAEGTITPIPVTVRLTSRILCRGKLVYGRMAIEGAGFEDSTFDTVSDDTSC